MYSTFPRAALWASAAILAGAPALAQNNDRPPPRSPLDAKADVPSLRYRSPFTAYQSITNEKPRSWKEVNDNVERVGGWREYLKEAQQGDAPSPPATRQTPAQGEPTQPSQGEPAKPAPGGRRGHGTH